MNIVHLLTSYKGRIRRLHFWLGLIGAGVVFGVVYSIITSMSMGAIASGGSPNPILMILGLIVDLVWLYVALAIYVKRAHDRDKSGWFVAIILIPLIGAIWLLIDLGFLDGTQGPNKYGPSPKGIGGDAPSPAAAE
jgi:uncharacterized membrane protein YhaH (DUF805 family)